MAIIIQATSLKDRARIDGISQPTVKKRDYVCVHIPVEKGKRVKKGYLDPVTSKIIIALLGNQKK